MDADDLALSQASDEQLVYSTAISSFSTVERSLLRSMTITYV